MNTALVGPAPAAALRVGGSLGPFNLLAEVHVGQRSRIWQAHDTRTQLDVALKLLSTDATGVASGRWLKEARAAIKLAHPHVVSVLDASLLDGHPTLVMPWLPGMRLRDWLKQQGPMAARPAVELMMGVVDALRAAHALGLVHRQITPDNILVGPDGMARLLNFGVAPPLGDGPHGAVSGVPGYLSPEALRGLPPDPAMDVFGVGLVLAELVLGKPVLAACAGRPAPLAPTDINLTLPDDPALDDALRLLLQRALARSSDRRTPGAIALRDGLLTWLQLTAADAQGEAGAESGALGFILHRMGHQSDFPALSASVMRIQRLASSDSDSLQALAGEILQDVALTQKLLRLVNSAHFRRDGAGVESVSRAVALVGQAGIRNLALSLVMVEHMKDKAHAQRLKEAFLRAVLAGQLAHQLCNQPRDAEEAFLAAMFYNLGPLLTEYYFPEAAQTVRDQLARHVPADPAVAAGAEPHPDLLADKIAEQVMGLGFGALGMGVARHWGLPDSLQRCMERPTTASPVRVMPTGPERTRWLALAANEAADVLWQANLDTMDEQLDVVTRRHGRALGIKPTELRLACDEARVALAQMAPAMGLSLPRPKARVVLSSLSQSPAAEAAMGVPLANAEDAAGAWARQLDAAFERLQSGMADINLQLAAPNLQLNRLLLTVLETIQQALGCQRVVFCLREAGGARLTGRFGLGDQVASLSPRFLVALTLLPGQSPDLLGAVCRKGNDMLVPDIAQREIAHLLPAWFKQHIRAKSILLLPMSLRDAPFGLIYADHGGPMPAGERERALLRSLRDLALAGFRRAGQ